VQPVASDSEVAKEIDAALEKWRQGDLAMDESWFVHVADPSVPLTDAAAQADGDGAQALMSEVSGLAVLTQTCDIVRTCTLRSYVEVAPLVLVNDAGLHEAERGRRIQHATLPALSSARLVVDLDRVMTVEKALVAKWTRTPGYTEDSDGRAFAQALARKRVRFAFPNDFVSLATKLQRRLIDRHEKGSDEGHALRALREIRVHASPSWDAEPTSIFFWFVRSDADTTFNGKNWAPLLKLWLDLVPTSGRFTSIDGLVVALEDMTAADYVASDPLDLDHLSSRAADE
jgi:hypothetical protein